MSVPAEPVPVPAVVAAIAAGRPVAAVWVNELGGVTFRIDGGREYVKVSPPQWAAALLVAEADAAALGGRLRRAAGAAQATVGSG